MTQENPSFKHILLNYQYYVQFQHKMLLNPSDISESEFLSIQNDFSQFYSKIDKITIWEEMDLTLKQFYLKYLTQYSIITAFDYKLFGDVMLRKASILQNIGLASKYFQNMHKMDKKVKILGYHSLFDAYLKIFQVDSNRLKKNLHGFLESSEEEYCSLYAQQLRFLGDPNKRLGKLLKTKLYRGEWLSNKYLNLPYSEIIHRTIGFLQKNGFISPIMMKKITIKKGRMASLLGGYDSVIFPIIDQVIPEMSGINVFLKESPDIAWSKKNIAHELGHCVQTLNITEERSFEKVIPYESAVSELGGTLFESLMCFPEYIAYVFEISDNAQSQQIAQYNRFIDLMFKRYYALTVLSYAEIFKSNKLSLRRILRVKRNFKKRSSEILGFKDAKFHFLRIDMVHLTDFIRGHLFIQEPFIKACNFNLNTFLGHRETLLTFFSRGASQSYGKALRYFEDEIFQKSTVIKNIKKDSEQTFKGTQNPKIIISGID